MLLSFATSHTPRCWMWVMRRCPMERISNVLPNSDVVTLNYVGTTFITLITAKTNGSGLIRDEHSPIFNHLMDTVLLAWQELPCTWDECISPIGYVPLKILLPNINSYIDNLPRQSCIIVAIQPSALSIAFLLWSEPCAGFAVSPIPSALPWVNCSIFQVA